MPVFIGIDIRFSSPWLESEVIIRVAELGVIGRVNWALVLEYLCSYDGYNHSVVTKSYLGDRSLVEYLLNSF